MYLIQTFFSYFYLLIYMYLPVLHKNGEKPHGRQSSIVVYSYSA